MFRFTIRDVLWLMVVVGLGFGWFVDRTRSVDAMRAERNKYKGEIHRQLNALEEQRRESDGLYRQLYPNKAKARFEERHKRDVEEWERLNREELLFPIMQSASTT